MDETNQPKSQTEQTEWDRSEVKAHSENVEAIQVLSDDDAHEAEILSNGLQQGTVIKDFCKNLYTLINLYKFNTRTLEKNYEIYSEGLFWKGLQSWDLFEVADLFWSLEVFGKTFSFLQVGFQLAGCLSKKCMSWCKQKTKVWNRYEIVEERKALGV